MASRPQLPELDYESMAAEEILRTFLDAFPGRVSLACSFQKEESVLLDMLLGLDPKARVFALDTHVLFPETYAVWREVERRYNTKVEVFEGPSLGRQAAVHGEALWASNPTLCCSIRKVAPLTRALAGLDALDHRSAPRPVADSRERAQGRLGRRPRAVEGKPARRLGRRTVPRLYRRARAAVQRAARPRLCVDRLHALHPAR